MGCEAVVSTGEGLWSNNAQADNDSTPCTTEQQPPGQNRFHCPPGLVLAVIIPTNTQGQKNKQIPLPNSFILLLPGLRQHLLIHFFPPPFCLLSLTGLPQSWQWSALHRSSPSPRRCGPGAALRPAWSAPPRPGSAPCCVSAWKRAQQAALGAGYCPGTGSSSLVALRVSHGFHYENGEVVEGLSGCLKHRRELRGFWVWSCSLLSLAQSSQDSTWKSKWIIKFYSMPVTTP